MININQITAQFARMSDQALQQYAQMHKDDPYTLSLALSESNRRKQTRQGAQMQAQEQPKVVDQELQNMAAPMPEDVGIGQLPAGDMNFAEGGIVAFSDGGDVPRYRDEGLVRPIIQYGGRYPGQPGGGPLTGQTGYEGMGPSELVRAIYEDLKKKIGPGLSPPEKARAEREAQRQANMIAAGHVAPDQRGSTYSPEKYGVTNPAPLVPGARGAFFQEATPPVDSAAVAAPDGGTAAPRQRPPAGGPGTAAPAAAAPTPPQGGLSDLQAEYNKIAAAQDYKDPAAAQLDALKAKETAAAKAERADLERDQARFAEAFTGREGRLTERATDIAKQKDTNTGLAFLNAGLAIMSTPGGLATALGKGAQVGTAQFAAGLDKIRSAQERLDDARDRLEDLKLNRAEMSAKEIRAADSKIRNIEVDAEKRAIDGIRQAAGVNETRAKTIFDKTAQLGITQLEVAGRERVAKIGLEGSMAQASATRAASEGVRMATLAENVRKNIAAEALKKFPYDTAKQAEYAQAELKAALRSNPALAQYLGVPGGGSAPSGADLRFDEKTGQFVSMR
jgi:hypothetical protein